MASASKNNTQTNDKESHLPSSLLSLSRESSSASGATTDSDTMELADQQLDEMHTNITHYIRQQKQERREQAISAKRNKTTTSSLSSPSSAVALSSSTTSSSPSSSLHPDHIHALRSLYNINELHIAVTSTSISSDSIIQDIISNLINSIHNIHHLCISAYDLALSNLVIPINLHSLILDTRNQRWSISSRDLLPSLTYIFIKCENFLDVNWFRSTLPQMPNLTSVTIQTSTNVIVNKYFIDSLSSLKKLTYLNLTDHVHFTHTALMIIESINNLKYFITSSYDFKPSEITDFLPLSKCNNLIDLSIDRPYDKSLSLVFLFNLKNIIFLDIQNPNITDLVITDMCRRASTCFHSLQVLNIGRCTAITYQSVIAIATLNSNILNNFNNKNNIINTQIIIINNNNNNKLSGITMGTAVDDDDISAFLAPISDCVYYDSSAQSSSNNESESLMNKRKEKADAKYAAAMAGRR